MSRAWDLERVPPPPPPPEPKLCAACKGYRAECVAPVGEGSMHLCWLCAHHVVDHGVAPELAITAECECLPHEIYPGRVDPRPRVEVVLNGHLVTIVGDERVPPGYIVPRFEHGDLKYDGSDKTPTIHGHLYNHKTRQIEAILQNPFAKVPRRRPHCSICDEVGHNAQTCTKR